MGQKLRPKGRCSSIFSSFTDSLPGPVPTISTRSCHLPVLTGSPQSTHPHHSTSPETQSIWPERAWLASCTMRSLLSKSVVNAISSPCARTPNASAMMLCQGHLHRLSRARNTSPRMDALLIQKLDEWYISIHLYIYTTHIFIYITLIYIYIHIH